MRQRQLAAFILAAVVPSALATTRVRQPTMKDMARAWLGGPPRGILEYARLQLGADGRGVMTVQFLPQHRPSAYRITATRLHEYSIAFDIEPADRESEPIYLRGSATPGSLELKMGGAARLKWERELFLETEEAVLGRIKAVSERAAAMERDGSW